MFELHPMNKHLVHSRCPFDLFLAVVTIEYIFSFHSYESTQKQIGITKGIEW